MSIQRNWLYLTRYNQPSLKLALPGGEASLEVAKMREDALSFDLMIVLLVRLLAQV